jgi:peptidoglycan L-alanyl-D-glutamate endopeptidase CwlK
MSADLTSTTTRNTDFDLLHPVVRAAVTAVLADLKTQQIPLFVFEAFRSPTRQNALYAQGRTKPGPKVTFAKAWQSYHQYGLAVDLVFGGPGKWTWNEPSPGMWKKMHTIGKKHGLMPLDFETPHLQLSGTSSSALIDGHFPSGGDDSWADNLRAAVTTWHGDPGAPPPPMFTNKLAVA